MNLRTKNDFAIQNIELRVLKCRWCVYYAVRTKYIHIIWFSSVNIIHSTNAAYASSSTCCSYQKDGKASAGNLPKREAVSEMGEHWAGKCLHLALEVLTYVLLTYLPRLKRKNCLFIPVTVTTCHVAMLGLDSNVHIKQQSEGGRDRKCRGGVYRGIRLSL